MGRATVIWPGAGITMLLAGATPHCDSLASYIAVWPTPNPLACSLLPSSSLLPYQLRVSSNLAAEIAASR
jgi:hypothetical protein